MIKKESRTPEEELKMALEIRNDDDVVTFRKQVFEIELVINQGRNTQEILAVLKLV